MPTKDRSNRSNKIIRTSSIQGFSPNPAENTAAKILAADTPVTWRASAHAIWEV